MGQTAQLRRPSVVTVEAYGTHPIRRIEVLRYQPGQKDFEVIHQWTPGSRNVLGRYADAQVRPGAVYDVCPGQSLTVRARPSMAWASPVWIRKDSRSEGPEEGKAVLKFSSR